MLIAIAPLLVAVAGALVFALTTDKLSEMGRLAFFAGLFWLVYVLATKTVRVG